MTAHTPHTDEAGRVVIKAKAQKSKKDGKYYANLRSGNSKILMSSQGYTSKQGADRVLETLRGAVIVIE